MQIFTRHTEGFRKGDVSGLTKGAKVTLGLLLALILFWMLCVRSVGAGQVGIITRFGEVNRTQNSGLALKLPYPIEKMTKMDIQVQKEEQESNAATADLQDVKATLALNYSLNTDDALRVYKELGVNYKERVVTPAVQESFKAASADYTAQELIQKRAEVKSQAFGVIKNRLEKYGIRVVDLNITNFTFSKEFNAAIEQVQVANQNVARAEQELRTTKVEAEKKIAAAQADAEAQRLQQQTLTPQLIEKMRIESQNQAIAKWNGQLPTTSLGSDSNILFNLQGNR